MDNLSLPCSINVCQNNGKCYLLVNRSTTTHYCLCNRCFTGNQCEIERYSKNLWIYGISEENKKDYNPYNETIVLGILDNLIIRSVIRQMMTLALASEQYLSSLFDNLAHVVHLLEVPSINPKMIDLIKRRNKDEATIANHIYDSKSYKSKNK
ncbi:unnamed protein product, partial [Rotaria sp. Silwood2]